MTSRASVLMLAMACVGCTYIGPRQSATIVAVHCNNVGENCYTMIQLEDGTRLKRQGTWGEVGDTFTAQRVDDPWNYSEQWK